LESTYNLRDAHFKVNGHPDNSKFLFLLLAVKLAGVKINYKAEPLIPSALLPAKSLSRGKMAARCWI